MTAEGHSTPNKTCKKCGESKPATLEFFTKKLDSLTSWCKPCIKESKAADWRLKSAAKNAERRAKRASLTDEERATKREQERQRYLRRKAAGEFAEKRSYTERDRERNKRYYSKHRARIIARQSVYATANIESIRARMSVYSYERRRSDPLFALALRVRALIGISLRSRSVCKSAKSEQILGCTIEEFAAHIQRQFLKGMSWENRSEWHLDHIIPMASAETEDDVIRLNHFTNLRPIWAKENLSKGAKVTSLL